VCFQKCAGKHPSFEVTEKQGYSFITTFSECKQKQSDTWQLDLFNVKKKQQQQQKKTFYSYK